MFIRYINPVIIIILNNLDTKYWILGACVGWAKRRGLTHSPSHLGQNHKVSDWFNMLEYPIELQFGMDFSCRIVEPHSPRSQQLLLIVHIQLHILSLLSTYRNTNTRSTTCRDHQQLSTSSTLLIRVIWGFALQPPGYFAQSALAAVYSSLSS